MVWLDAFMGVVFVTAVFGLLSPYLIYPLTVWPLARLYNRRHLIDDSTPSVTLVISAFNEADVIEIKLKNALALEYPREQLEIMVISDGSDDGTDEIVRRFSSSGVKLCRQEPRKGKSSGLTKFVPEASGSLIVFSDANSMYDSLAIRKLVRHFADPHVGYAVGHQRFFDSDGNIVADSESVYWSYEVWLKEQESAVSSVVGGDGAIYAIRASLFEALGEEDINDFLNPLQIVARGYRGVFDREAFCHEHSARSFAGEFRRKSRIVNRSLQAIAKVPRVLDPRRTGWFAYQLVFHKGLRWFMPYFLLLAMIASLSLQIRGGGWIYSLTLVGIAGIGLLAALYALPAARRFPLVYLAYFFVLGNCAALVGSLKLLFGRRIVMWTPERQSQ